MGRNTHKIFVCVLGYFLLLQPSEAQSQPASIENAKAKHQEISQAQPEARLVSLAIIASKSEVSIGESVLLSVTGKYTDGIERKITTGITWTTSDANIALVNSRGELRGLKPGTVEIRASYAGLTSLPSKFFVKEDSAAGETILEQRRRIIRDPQARERAAREAAESERPTASERPQGLVPDKRESSDTAASLSSKEEPKPTPAERLRSTERQAISPKAKFANGSKTSKIEATPKRLDDILKEMDWGNIAFNSPSTMNLRDTVTIQLLLSLAHGLEELSSMISAEGEKENAKIKVSDIMEADLTGLDFDIVPITPKEQAISRFDTTMWTWRVRPKSRGLHDLHLTLTAKFDLNGAQTQRPIRTFEKTITVEVTTADMVKDFVADNWLWLWAVFALPVGAWAWKKRRREPELELRGGIFISYRREDSAGYAQAIYTQLTQHISKDRIFMDVEAIKPGVEFSRVLQQGVAKCDVMIAVIGKRWLGIEGQTERRIDDPKDFVRLEVSTALAREIPVIPVLVEGATMPSEDTLPEDLKKLKHRQWIELSNTRFAYDLGRLLNAVRDVVKVEALPAREPSAGC